MNATISTSTNGNMSNIIIKRGMSFKIIPVATSDVNKVIKAYVIALANAGYNVIER